MKIGRQLLPLPPPNALSKEADERTIWIHKDGRWQKWQYYDPKSGRFFKLVFVKEGKPPTVEISGIKMHVTQNGDPEKDTHRKLRTLRPVSGTILDTCCGLGYSAIHLGRVKDVHMVVTVEKDPTMIAICKENPWSAELWHNPKIHLIAADVSHLIATFPSGRFSAVVHDPPRFALAPELYEISFYREIWRVLRDGGKLYHYTGDPHRKGGRGLPQRARSRLREAGFSKVRLCYQGVCARK